MKYITALLLAASFNLSAGDHEKCKLVSSLSNDIMKYRQRGVSMAELMEHAKTDIYREIVMDAYSKTRYGAPVHINQAISIFKNEWYMKCMKTK